MNFRWLTQLFFAFVLASFIHFVHNAEFLKAYPGLPQTWTRGGVYAAWMVMTSVGLIGWWLSHSRHRIVGLALISLYAVCGLDSLAHFYVAPIHDHTATMIVTIIAEVAAALVLFVYCVRCAVAVLRTPSRPSSL